MLALPQRILVRIRVDGSLRLQSTLAETMKQAVSGIDLKKDEEEQRRALEEQRDSKVILPPV